MFSNIATHVCRLVLCIHRVCPELYSQYVIGVCTHYVYVFHAIFVCEQFMFVWCVLAAWMFWRVSVSAFHTFINTIVMIYKCISHGDIKLREKYLEGTVLCLLTRHTSLFCVWMYLCVRVDGSRQFFQHTILLRVAVLWESLFVHAFWCLFV